MKSSADWLILGCVSGTGAEVVTLSASVNETGASRSAAIKIYDEGIDCAAPYSLTITQAPLPQIHSISYENTKSADNPNPSTYSEGQSFVFEPLDAIAGYSFGGWKPDRINETNTQDVVASAIWTPVNYQVAYEANGGTGYMDTTTVVYDTAFPISNNGFAWDNHEFLGWACARDADVSYYAGDVVSNLASIANETVTLYAVWKELLVAPVITPEDGHVFYGNLCEVTIYCPTEGAANYYTTNGNTPKPSSANLYAGPFAIEKTTTVRAVAVKDGEKLYATAVVTKSAADLTLETALGNMDDVVVATGGSAEWHAIVDSTSTSGLSVQSGGIQDNNESWLQAEVSGEGTISFMIKTSCEHDEDNTFTWDCLKVFVDGDERQDWRMDGESNWEARTVVFTFGGAHTVRWVYHKDESETSGEDCAWVSGLIWSPVRHQTLYVDADGGSDSADGQTAETALATIQSAIDRSADGDTILVADGVYAPIETKNRIITIESVNGCKNANIDGGNANNCALLGGPETLTTEEPLGYGELWQGTNTVLRGFTLRNGRAAWGAGVTAGTVENCLIVGNTVEVYPWSSPGPNGLGGGAYLSVLRNCTITGNSSIPAVSDDDETKYGGAGGGSWGCTLHNCIEWGNEDDPGEIGSEGGDWWNESVYESCCLQDPLFVDSENDDYRVFSTSPCIVEGVVVAGCETGMVEPGKYGMPEISEEEGSSWVSDSLAAQYAKSGESADSYASRFTEEFGSDASAALTKATGKIDSSGNAMYVWQDYVAGTDPLDTNSVFAATIEMVDGSPVVTWSPKLNAGEEARRRYTIYGKTNLTDRTWHSPTNSASRFFKVGVEMR